MKVSLSRGPLNNDSDHAELCKAVGQTMNMPQDVVWHEV